MKNKNLFKLAKSLIKLRERAKRLGIFTDDRKLLECPQCGLMEDIDIDGRVFTIFKNSLYKDSGLEFERVEGKENNFRCPNCREVIRLKSR